jgi:hypothetical protein
MTIAVVLLIVVAFVGYELNWVRQRRAARTEFADGVAQFDSGIGPNSAAPFSQTVPPRGVNYVDQFVIWALDKHSDHVLIPCPTDDAKLVATFDDHTFDPEAIEELEQVRRARRLFPESEVLIMFLTDSDSKLIPFVRATVPPAP